MKNFCLILILIINYLTARDIPRPVNTYSIVAYDSAAGQMGVAVQSHWFQVGAIVSWAEAGVGVIATQSFVDVAYGPLGLDLMRGGKNAEQALQALLAIDPQKDVRQVAMIDVNGNVAVHTGEKCIQHAGHISSSDFSAQANLMEKNSVWPAMADAFKEAKGDLLSRMMEALNAAQAEGGDIRGSQSCAILIVPIESDGKHQALQKIVDLRVDDHPQPLEEMQRLIKIHRAYDHMNKGDDYLSRKNISAALREYDTAHSLYPENVEILYWTAVTLAAEGKIDESLPLFKKVFTKEPIWMELTKRLPKAGLLPDDKLLLDKIINAGN
jgi:uncharacterized Ntn-hydrolase superfamily protein